MQSTNMNNQKNSVIQNINEEIEKCKSPYYFATTYMKLKDRHGNWIPFITNMSEEEFNKYFENETDNRIQVKRKESNS